MGCRKSIACSTLGLSLRTVQRWEKQPHMPDRRRGPINGPPNKLNDNERQIILQTVNSKDYASLSPTQIVPKLADRGFYIGSESTLYRVLKEHRMLCHRGKAKQRVPYRKPVSCKATQPNQVWSWDITFLNTPIKGTFYYLYLILDIYSRKIVGFKAFEKQDAAHASQVVLDACQREKISQNQIKLHSDNGSPMKGATMLATLQKLGVIPSFSRPSVSNDNPFSEALFRTLKYCPQYPTKPFESVAHANLWMSQFVKWYNTIHLHSGIKFLTPESRHRGIDQKIIMNREKVYELARKNNPTRWTGPSRNWRPETTVYLNPDILDARAA